MRLILLALFKGKKKDKILTDEEIKNKIEILTTIATMQKNEFHQRRVYEWKVIFAVLGIFASLAAAKIARNITIDDICSIVFIFHAFLVLTIITSIYLIQIHKANKKNKDLAEAAENDLIYMSEGRELEKALKRIKNTKSGFPGEYWSVFWQIIFISIFALASWFVICFL
jgi:hypothetical protein